MGDLPIAIARWHFSYLIDGSRVAVIDRMAVLKTYRFNGYGSMICKSLISDIQANTYPENLSISQIIALVVKENSFCSHLSKLGFVPALEGPIEIKGSVTLISMTKFV